jgi:glycosyltransferase involved in cell wall biosynthesis
VKNHQIDMVVASSANAGIYARLLRILLPSVVVIYVSHGWSAIYRGNRFYQWIEKGFSYLSSSILVVSQSDHDKAVQVLGISPRKLKLIENSIYPLSLVENKKKIVNQERLQVLMIARFDTPKRQDILIHAAKVLPHMDFHFVGEGLFLQRSQKNASENITFWGGLSDVREPLFLSDICVLLSESEGMPLSVLEALSCAKPLLLSDIPSLRTFMDQNGLLVENRVDAVVSALETLLHKDLSLLGRVSKNMFDARFNLMLKKEVYLSYYASCLDKNR